MGTKQDPSDPSIVSRSWWRPLCLLGVFMLAFSVYANSLHGGIVFDDKVVVSSNLDLRPQTPWSSLWFNDYWGSPINAKTWTHKSYRPLSVMTLRLNYMIGEEDTFSYHLFNVLFHCVTSVLVVYVGARCGMNFAESVLFALFFAAHPVHCEAVSNITGRADVLGGLFFIVSFLVYATACEQDSLLWSAVVTILSQVMVAMATLSKETGIVAVGVHILYEILYCTPLLSVLWMNRPSGDRETRRTASWWSFSIVRASIVCGAAAMMLYARHRISGGFAIDMDERFNVLMSMTPLTRWCNIIYLWWKNLFLLFYPRNLIFDYSAMKLFGDDISRFHICLILLIPVCVIIVLSTLTITMSLYNCGANCTFSQLSLLLFVRNLRYRQQILFFAGWTIGTQLPASQLLFYVGFLMAERVLYVPSLGVCALMAKGFAVLHNHRSFRTNTGSALLLAGIVLLLASYSGRTWLRNKDWQTPRTLYKSAIAVHPNNTIAHHGLGWIAYRDSNYEEAKKWFSHIPDDQSALYLQGKMAVSEKKPYLALDYFHRLLDDYPNHSANNEVGVIYWNLGHQEAGANHILHSARAKIAANAPEKLAILTNTGCMHHMWREDYNTALEYAQQAMDRLHLMFGAEVSGYTKAVFCFNLASAYAMTKQYDVAIEWYKQAAAHSPKFAGSDQRFLDALRGGEHFSAVCILSQFG